MSTRRKSLAIATLALAIAGCGGGSSTPSAAKVPTGPSAAGKALLLTAQPAEAQQVIAARNDAKDDQEIVVVGRIGGGTDPWVQGTAAFTIVDNSLKACTDIPGDKCPTPWDYCCEADVAKARTLVKLVGADGVIIGTDARELLGVQELQTVYVQGKARRDADGNLSILASRVYVAPGGTVPPAASDGDHSAGHEHSHDHAHKQAEPAVNTGAPAQETSNAN